MSANDLPKLAANNRDKATVERKAKAIVAGSIAYYGTYTVDEGTKTIIPTVEGATFPNMVGTDQSRIVYVNNGGRKCASRIQRHQQAY